MVLQAYFHAWNSRFTALYPQMRDREEGKFI